MSDDTVSTVVTLADGRDVSFQEYFVQLRHAVTRERSPFEGADRAVLAPGVERQLTDADCVLIAPSNPLVSIAPIRALAGVDALLAARRHRWSPSRRSLAGPR